MSGPLLFFMFIIVGDLVLKSLKDKKKIERSKQDRQGNMQGRPNVSQNRPMESRQRPMEKQEEKPGSIREMMSTLREEVEIEKKAYDDNKYWEEKRNQESNKKEIAMKVKVGNKEIDIKEDLIRGIIFSEIFAEPKSIQNQKRRI